MISTRFKRCLDPWTSNSKHLSMWTFPRATRSSACQIARVKLSTRAYVKGRNPELEYFKRRAETQDALKKKIEVKAKKQVEQDSKDKVFTIIREVHQQDVGMRLDRWIRSEFPKIPQAKIEQLLRKKKILLANDGNVFEKAQSKDRVGSIKTRVKVPASFVHETKDAPKVVNLSPEEIKRVQSWVLYKDEHIIVLNKPANLAVQGGTGVSVSVVDYLEALRYEKSEAPALVHRLDQGASGILVLARDKIAARHLQMAWSKHEVKKLYWAIVIGVPERLSAGLRCKLAKVTEDAMEKVVVVDEEMDDEDEDLKSKYAVSRYHTIAHLSDVISLLALRPTTGRKHQLRVQCAQLLKTPIFGDYKYGIGFPYSFASIITRSPIDLHLHAKEIAFRHPITRKLLHFETPMPSHFEATIKDFGGFQYDDKLAQYATLTPQERKLEKISNKRIDFSKKRQKKRRK